MRFPPKWSDDIKAFIYVFGAFSAFASIVAILNPAAAIEICRLFIIIACLYLCYIVAKRWKPSFVSYQPPSHLHADWDATELAARLDNIELEKFKEKLERLENIALRLLITDRLETGGWSKTQAYRFVDSGKPLSPIGTLTGTFLSIEALKPYGYLHFSEASHLSKKLAEIIVPDGRVKLRLQRNGVGTMELKDENLRHSSAWLLLRVSLGVSPTMSDINCLSKIANKLNERLESAEGLKGSRDVKDMMGTAFATVALLTANSWLEKSNHQHIKLIQQSLTMFSNSEELSTPGHIAWASEGGGVAGAETATQWATVWLLGMMIDWNGIDNKTRMSLIDRLLDLIEANIAVLPTQAALFPHAFSLDAAKHPHGESLMATSMACYTVTMLLASPKSNIDRERAYKILPDLLRRITAKGEEYTTVHSLEEPFEGYLCWASLILAIRPFLHYIPFDSTDQLHMILLAKETARAGENSAFDKIDLLYKKANVKLYPNGLFQQF